MNQAESFIRRGKTAAWAPAATFRSRTVRRTARSVEVNPIRTWKRSRLGAPMCSRFRRRRAVVFVFGGGIMSNCWVMQVTATRAAQCRGNDRTLHRGILGAPADSSYSSSCTCALCALGYLEIRRRALISMALRTDAISHP